MARSRLKLTRAQLGAFLGKDSEAIRQFEQLFAEVDAASITGGGEDGIELLSGNAYSSAQSALDQIQSIANDLPEPPRDHSMSTMPDVYAPMPETYGITQYNKANNRWEHTLIAVGLKYGGTATDHSFFEADGTLVFNGDAVVWNDWNLVRDFTPTAGAGVPVRNILVGNIVKDQFAVGDSLQFQSAELLHDWKEGTDLQVHIHWDTGGLNDATVRGVKWQIEYSVCNPIESGVLPYTRVGTVVQSMEFTIGANEADRTEHVGTIYTIPAGTLKVGAHLIMVVKRIASVTNPAPVADPFLISFGVHFQSDTVGSRSVFSK